MNGQEPTEQDLQVIAALATELTRRIPALESLDRLGAAVGRASKVGHEIEFDLAGVLPLETVERAYVSYVLERCGGNRSEAADALGIDPSTLYRKLKRWGL